VRHAAGSWVWIEGVGSDQLRNPSIRGILLNSRDITARKQAEAEVARKLRELTVLNAVAAVCVEAASEDALLERATAIIGDTLFPDDCGVLLVDEAAMVLRYAPGYRPRAAGTNRDPIPLGTGITGAVVRSGAARREADVTKAPDYLERVPAMRSEICVPLRLGPRVIGVIDAEAARPAAFTADDESLLVTLAAQLATAIGRLRAAQAHRESEERFRRLAEAAFEGIGITDQGIVIDANSRLAEMFGCTIEEMRGRPVMEFVAPESTAAVTGFIRQGVDSPYEHLARRRDGSVFPVETQGKPLAAGAGTMRVAAVRDITERKRAEDRIKRQLERLAALHAIDSAISGGMGLSDMLTLALDQVVAQLRVDAADVLLLEPGSQKLAPAASIGFRAPFAGAHGLPLDESCVGRAIATRQIVVQPALAEERDASPRTRQLLDEGFSAYCAAPLVAKDVVRGALEVFCRGPLAPDQEWLDYFGTLAGQLAIALENRALVASLQRSNAELGDAYDTTLAGWSHALELRDRETHGHTERVVRLTIDLARGMGVDEATLVHMRRGALLHDIGKMGIPDTILFKPGPLTSEEWEVMRQHPRIALELLAPIAFLRPALDIPCHHHERWDGSGYPLGLAGEQIPRPARIFAVVDAWDALRVARPYREAWDEDEVNAYLREEAGKQFDPAVVECFLRMMRPDRPVPDPA
ncbi:MAG TPA: HD domain-containing phosphohydrolase, partial [Thermoanaerobaculaceae bacterium]|nr:HD domain-containing phosphohydrolase [Thermoanaerobaculaceae bacterium]